METESVIESKTKESEPRYPAKPGRSKDKSGRNRDKMIESVKTELWTAFSFFPRGAGRSDDDLPDAETEWYLTDFSQPSTSKSIEEYSGAVCRFSSPSEKFDCSVLQILDEQLDAIIGQESEETIAATLETIIEICSTSSAVRTPCRSQFASSHIDSLDFGSSPPDTSQNNLQETSSSQLALPSTNQFSTLKDFTNDDVVFGSLSPRTRPRYGDDGNRPRSADSSSTAPLTPFGSPHTPTIIDLDQRRSTPLDQIPLKGRVEQMMFCAAAHRTGQCNCGLGDWFHDVTP